VEPRGGRGIVGRESGASAAAKGEASCGQQGYHPGGRLGRGVALAVRDWHLASSASFSLYPTITRAAG